MTVAMRLRDQARNSPLRRWSLKKTMEKEKKVVEVVKTLVME